MLVGVYFTVRLNRRGEKRAPETEERACILCASRSIRQCARIRNRRGMWPCATGWGGVPIVYFGPSIVSWGNIVHHCRPLLNPMLYSPCTFRSGSIVQHHTGNGRCKATHHPWIPRSAPQLRQSVCDCVAGRQLPHFEGRDAVFRYLLINYACTCTVCTVRAHVPLDGYPGIEQQTPTRKNTAVIEQRWRRAAELLCRK